MIKQPASPPQSGSTAARPVFSYATPDNDVGGSTLGARHTTNISNAALLRWMFTFLKPVRLEAALTIAYLFGSNFFEVAVTNYFSNAVNFIAKLREHGQGWRNGFSHLLLLAGASLVLLLVFRYLREVGNSKMSMKMVYYIREAVYDKLQHVGFGFHDTVSTGQLITRALTDLQNVRQFVQTALLQSLEIFFVLALYMGGLYQRSPKIALLSLVPLPLWTWYVLRFGKIVQPKQKAVLEAEERNTSLITENIAGVHVVKAFATQKQEIAKYFLNCDDFRNRTLLKIRTWADFTPYMRAIATGSMLTLFFAAAALVIKGTLNAGDFLFLGAAMNAILGRLQQVSAINEQYQNAIVSAKRLYEVLMAPSTVPESPSARPLPFGMGEVEFQNVSFGYDPAKPVLRDVNFKIKPGSIVAIVGPTGSGKSTLVSLIARYYDPQQGRIFIDGMDVRDAALDSIRNQVGIVFQETYLFSDTVEANISYGRPNVRGGEVEAAARLAQAHEFIEELALGYQTLLGERGSSLSGGQKQRLAIARAILFNPRVLILDDATAAIDPETEDLIRRGMSLVLFGRTVFLIAHRISTVKRADVVMVLEGGQITQMGTHEQLMRERGHYRHIAAVQLRSDEEVSEAAASDQPDVGLRLGGNDSNPSHMKRMADEKQVAAVAEAAAAKEAAQEREAV